MFLKPVTGTAYVGLDIKQMADTGKHIHNFDTETSWKLYIWKIKRDMRRNLTQICHGERL